MADERIKQFHVEIEVEQDGDLMITENILVSVEGRDIRRGIFRDLPAYYLDEGGPGRLPYRFTILGVLRDGVREPYARERVGNAVQIRIGDANVFLEHRDHQYQIRYHVKNGIRYGEFEDELYLNITGNYWSFPIDSAWVSVRFPGGADITQVNAYTGALGANGRDYQYERNGDRHRVSATVPFSRREGLTVSLSVEKGVIDPPSLSDQGWLWWARNGALAALIGSLVALFGFYFRSFDRVGRDPVKGPIFPQYEPPKGYSPAAAHHIYFRSFRSHDALIASLMYLAGKGLMRIDVDKNDKKKTVLEPLDVYGSNLVPDETAKLYDQLFAGRSRIELGKKYDAGFTKAYTSFRKGISAKYGSSYFKWNLGYVVIGGALSIGAIIFAANQASYWSLWHTGAVIALIALNCLFMYLMPAPTRKGQDVHTHLAGFRLYMEKAEKLQLNSVEVGSDAPPPMTVERYETFLPYAVALGVEKPWSDHFERLIPEAAQDYNPSWTNMNARTFGSTGGMTRTMVSGMSSGVASAMPQSSGSSGSSGGGFSGGGGGGGGGGGW
ncbi:MAG: DUF2207 domain-containing protein [Pseudomonadota bacterium]